MVLLHPNDARYWNTHCLPVIPQDCLLVVTIQLVLCWHVPAVLFIFSICSRSHNVHFHLSKSSGQWGMWTIIRYTIMFVLCIMSTFPLPENVFICINIPQFFVMCTIICPLILCLIILSISLLRSHNVCNLSTCTSVLMQPVHWPM